MKKVAVLFGGPSPERVISELSAKNVFNALKRTGYFAKMIEYDENNFSELRDFDIIFNIMHGKPGEDGIVQEMLESLNVPYTGSGVIASRLTINKFNTQCALKSIGIPMPKSILITEQSIKKDIEIIKNTFEDKVILKPNTGGSSIGIFIMDKNKAVIEIGNLIKEYGDYLCEQFIDNGKELTVSVIEENGKARVLTPLELKPKNDYYDYEAKYTTGMTDFIIPSHINKKTQEQLNEYTKKIFEELNLRSFARVDYIVKNSEIYELEVNSIPGMTDLSDLPAEAKYDGINYDELIEKIIKTAGVNKDA